MSQLAKLNRLKKEKFRNEKDNRAGENSLKFRRTKKQCHLEKKEHYSEEI